MLKYTTLILLISYSLSCHAKPVSKDTTIVSKDFSTQKPTMSKYERTLQNVFTQIQKDYAPILESYKKVKAAKPAEYAFYIDALKDVIIEAVESNKLEYKDMAAKAGYALFTSVYDIIEFQRKPLLKFTALIIPKTVHRLEFNKKRAKKSPLLQEVNQLIQQLNDIKRLVNRY
jgi:hypothetical protein